MLVLFIPTTPFEIFNIPTVPMATRFLVPKTEHLKDYTVLLPRSPKLQSEIARSNFEKQDR